MKKVYVCRLNGEIVDAGFMGEDEARDANDMANFATDGNAHWEPVDIDSLIAENAQRKLALDEVIERTTK